MRVLQKFWQKCGFGDCSELFDLGELERVATTDGQCSGTLPCLVLSASAASANHSHNTYQRLPVILQTWVTHGNQCFGTSATNLAHRLPLHELIIQYSSAIAYAGMGIGMWPHDSGVERSICLFFLSAHVTCLFLAYTRSTHTGVLTVMNMPPCITQCAHIPNLQSIPNPVCNNVWLCKKKKKTVTELVVAY